MALSNRDRVGKALEQLGRAFGPYIDRRMSKGSPMGGNWKATYSDANVDDDPSAQLEEEMAEEIRRIKALEGPLDRSPGAPGPEPTQPTRSLRQHGQHQQPGANERRIFMGGHAGRFGAVRWHAIRGGAFD